MSFGHSDYVNYFQDLAQRNVDIADVAAKPKRAFHFMDMSELVESASRQMTSLVFILEQYEGYVPGVNDNFTLGKRGSFMILEHVKGKKRADIIAARDKCEQIGIQVLARMEEDREHYKEPGYTGNSDFLAQIDFKKAVWFPTGPLFDEKYGYTFEFSILGGGQMRYDENKWI